MQINYDELFKLHYKLQSIRIPHELFDMDLRYPDTNYNGWRLVFPSAKDPEVSGVIHRYAHDEESGYISLIVKEHPSGKWVNKGFLSAEDCFAIIQDRFCKMLFEEDPDEQN